MSLIIGIDVGGTHADGVLINGNTVLDKKKVSVDQHHLEEAIISLLKALVPDKKEQLSRIHLSTTLCTNAIVNNTLDRVGMLIQTGPGLNPDFFNCGPFTRFLDGAIDHRGQVIKNPSRRTIDEAIDSFRQNDIKSVGIVTKFSHRNNIHEQQIHDRIKNRFLFVSMGHRISGLPNFPRRVYSTWLNGALTSDFHHFQQAMQHGFTELDLSCPSAILKADGGTIPFAAAATIPAESVHSGPSASVMGALALHASGKDTILLDIGGTTTDIALLAGGSPLLEPYGITIKGRPTLIRALNTTSVGLGGDSLVSHDNGTFTIGPSRSGRPMAFGGPAPTPTDALVVTGRVTDGSVEQAEKAMYALRADQPPLKTAEELLKSFTLQIKTEVELMIDRVFSRPVYTVAALLERKKIEPKELVAVGGPAAAIQKSLSETFGMTTIVPEHYEVANAIGAARTRPTLQATLYADTANGTLSIPEAGCYEQADRFFSMRDAEKRLTRAISDMAASFGMQTLPPLDFLEPQEMNTVSGFSTSGKIIYLKAQIRPGLQEQ
ncbi:MAG: methylhydantoinase [Desulfobacterales bacterium]|nr:MAG: methylhydantoinase [Desulfobacterales bacterium]